VRDEPTDEEVDAIERHKHKALAISVKAQHRRRIFCGAMQTESTEQLAARFLKRPIAVMTDCTEAELKQLREAMYAKRGI
jgi:hypothetical protein